MRNGDFYQHYKGGEYFFEGIALPVDEVQDKRGLEKAGVAWDAHTPDDVEYPQELQLFMSKEGVLFISAPYPHVIYQAEKDYNTEKVWARKVDDFFSMVNITPFQSQKRFTLKEKIL